MSTDGVGHSPETIVFITLNLRPPPTSPAQRLNRDPGTPRAKMKALMLKAHRMLISRCCCDGTHFEVQLPNSFFIRTSSPAAFRDASEQQPTEFDEFLVDPTCF